MSSTKTGFYTGLSRPSWQERQSSCTTSFERAMVVENSRGSAQPISRARMT